MKLKHSDMKHQPLYIPPDYIRGDCCRSSPCRHPGAGPCNSPALRALQDDDARSAASRADAAEEVRWLAEEVRQRSEQMFAIETQTMEGNLMNDRTEAPRPTATKISEGATLSIWKIEWPGGRRVYHAITYPDREEVSVHMPSTRHRVASTYILAAVRRAIAAAREAS